MLDHLLSSELIFNKRNYRSKRKFLHYLEFIRTADTTGTGIKTVLLKKLKDLGIAITDLRDEGYTNDANMKRNKEVQNQIRELNPQALLSHRVLLH